MRKEVGKKIMSVVKKSGKTVCKVGGDIKRSEVAGKAVEILGSAAVNLAVYYFTK